MHRLALAAFLILAAGVHADDDALYQKHRLRFTEVDGKFLPLPVIPKKIEPIANLKAPIKIGTVGSTRALVNRIRPGDDDLVVNLLAPGTNRPQMLMRIKGHATKGLIDGETIELLNIVVVDTCDVQLTNGASQKIFLAVTAEKARAGLTKEQFAELQKQGVKLD